MSRPPSPGHGSGQPVGSLFHCWARARSSSSIGRLHRSLLSPSARHYHQPQVKPTPHSRRPQTRRHHHRKLMGVPLWAPSPRSPKHARPSSRVPGAPGLEPSSRRPEPIAPSSQSLRCSLFGTQLYETRARCAIITEPQVCPCGGPAPPGLGPPWHHRSVPSVLLFLLSPKTPSPKCLRPGGHP